MRKEEFIKMVNDITLESMEIYGGHTLLKHFDQTQSDLIDRCAREKRDIASAFTISREKALELIKESLLNEEYEEPECITEWVNDNSDGGDYFSIKEFDEVIGEGYYRKPWHEWENGPVPCRSITVVLRKVERRNDTIFKIITAYPTATDADIKEMMNKNM